MAEGTFGNPEVVEEELDILLIGGGMACCGAAFEIMRWAEAAKAETGSNSRSSWSTRPPWTAPAPWRRACPRSTPTSAPEHGSGRLRAHGLATT